MNNNNQPDGQNGNFWTTLPGILAALAGVIGAIAALITAWHNKPIDKSLPDPSPLDSKTTIQSSNFSRVTLSNGRFINLEKLEDSLKNKDFQSANAQTKVLLFDIANLPNSKNRFENDESKKNDCNGLKAIDTLWKKYSEGKFGLSIQKEILLDVQSWDRFVEKVGWQQNEKPLEDRFKLNYDISAPIGHLPGTLFWITEDSNFYAGISCNL